MRSPRLVFFLSAPLCALFLFAASAAGETATAGRDGQETMRITADSIQYSNEEKTLTATGDIRINYADFGVTGRDCLIHTETLKGVIQGDVRLKVENANITAREMDFSLDTGFGTLLGAEGVFGNNLTFTADRVERRSADRFIIDEGSVTSCPAENREWVFKARRLDVRVEGIAFFEGVSLQFYGVPVFYSPYWFAPAVTKRTTGLLLPGIGYSSAGGATVKNSFFWAISDQDDASIYLDWMDRRGIREGLEYRYAFAERTTGQLNVDYLNDRSLGQSLYSVKYDHRMKINGYTDSMARADLESGTSYSKEFDNGTLMRTRRYTDSFANVNFTGGPYALSITGRDQRELEAVDGEIFSKRPELLLAAMPRHIAGMPLVAEGSASAASFSANRHGGEISRLDARPRLSLPVTASPYLNVTPWAEGRSTWYSRSSAENRAFAVNYYAAGAGVEGPRMHRIFDKGEEPWKHVITPRLDFIYVPGYEIGGDDRRRAAPLDAVDNHDPKTLATVSLLNRVYARARDGEIMRLNISQGYDYREAQRGDIVEKRPWADLMVEFKSRPADWLLLNADIAYNHYGHELSAMSQEMGLTWGYFHFSYDRRFVNAPRSTFSSGLVSYRFSNAYSTEISAIYDEDRREATGSLVTVNWESCCWGLSLNAGARRRTEQLAGGEVRSETDNRFFFSIHLKGIGDLGEKSAPLIPPKVRLTDAPLP